MRDFEHGNPNAISQSTFEETMESLCEFVYKGARATCTACQKKLLLEFGVTGDATFDMLNKGNLFYVTTY